MDWSLATPTTSARLPLRSIIDFAQPFALRKLALSHDNAVYTSGVEIGVELNRKARERVAANSKDFARPTVGVVSCQCCSYEQIAVYARSEQVDFLLVKRSARPRGGQEANDVTRHDQETESEPTLSQIYHLPVAIDIWATL